jgi:23S rRNA G2445 N2-methylase RlmL
MSASSTYPCEADVVIGLERFAAHEIERLGGRVVSDSAGNIRFTQRGPLQKLLTLRGVLAVYLVQTIAVSRPKALLGDANARALLAQIDTTLSACASRDIQFRTFMLAASGAQSTVMQRIAQMIAAHTKLTQATEAGDLLVRMRPSREAREAREPREIGWDVLVRIGADPLANRPWRVCLVEGALQATVAHVMAQLTRPAASDICLNLCCGSGTLLIERAALGPASRLIGCDIDPYALACAERNIAAANYPIELHAWDATTVPLPDNSVDVLLADLPFGIRVGSHRTNEALYPALLREAGRVAKLGARFALISAEVKLLQYAIAQIGGWLISESLRIDLGGLRPQIVLLKRE